MDSWDATRAAPVRSFSVLPVTARSSTMSPSSGGMDCGLRPRRALPGGRACARSRPVNCIWCSSAELEPRRSSGCRRLHLASERTQGGHCGDSRKEGHGQEGPGPKGTQSAKKAHGPKAPAKKTDGAQDDGQESQAPPAKKTAARKTTAKKTTARKTTAKKVAKRRPAKKTAARKTTAEGRRSGSGSQEDRQAAPAQDAERRKTTAAQDHGAQDHASQDGGQEGLVHCRRCLRQHGSRRGDPTGSPRLASRARPGRPGRRRRTRGRRARAAGTRARAARTRRGGRAASRGRSCIAKRADVGTRSRFVPRRARSGAIVTPSKCSSAPIPDAMGGRRARR